MEDGFHNAILYAKGTDGVEYVLVPYEATTQRLENLWQNAGRYSFLFSEFTEGDRLLFINYFLQPGVVIGSIVRVDTREEVGIVYADYIRPEHSARVHYLFTDKTQRTREPVILAALRWFMDEFLLRRIDIEVPWFAYAALRRLHAMRIRPEGIKRDAVWRGKRWSSLLLFGVLRSELTDDAVTQGHLMSEDFVSRSWFGLLDDEPTLARAILKRD